MLVLEASSSGIDERFDGLENTDPVKWMYEVYKLFKEEWSRSGEAEKVANVLQEKIMSRGDIEVTEAMCVGILPMHDRDRVCQGTDVMEVIREESLGQLAIFSCWLETLRSRFNISKVYVQDSAPIIRGFREVDVRFLRMLDLTVLWENSAPMYIKKSTFLFAPWAHAGIVLPLLVHVQPALFIGWDWRTYCSPSWIETMPLRMYLLQHPGIRSFYEARSFFSISVRTLGGPGGGWGRWVGDMKMYWEAGDGEFMDDAAKRFYEDVKPIIEDRDIFAWDDPRQPKLPRRMSSISLRGKWEPEPTSNPGMLSRLTPLRKLFEADVTMKKATSTSDK